MALRGEQVPIKHAWLALRKCPIKGSYNPNVKLWLCPCGAQKYNSYLLCKHLIQVLPLPDPDWWATVVQQHQPPFYDIRTLLCIEEQETAPSLDALGPRYWLGSHETPPRSVSQNIVSSF